MAGINRRFVQALWTVSLLAAVGTQVATKTALADGKPLQRIRQGTAQRPAGSQPTPAYEEKATPPSPLPAAPNEQPAAPGLTLDEAIRLAEENSPVLRRDLARIEEA